MSSLDIDPTTQSNYLDVATSHIDLLWNIDFKAKIIAGSAKHTLVAKKDVKEIMQVKLFHVFILLTYFSGKI